MGINANPEFVTKLGGFLANPVSIIVGQGGPTAQLKRPAGVFYYDEVAQDYYASGGVVNNAAVWVAIGGQDEFDPPLVIGTSGDRVTATEGAFSAAGNVSQVFASTAGGTAGTTYRAIRGDLSVSTGNGSESPQAIRGNLTVAASGDLEEGYAGFFLATQSDGSAIDSNLIGGLFYALVNEVTPADQPQQWIYGGQSIVGFGASAGVPTAAVVAGHASYVTYDAPMDGIAHGYVASRNGSGAGGTAGSAYKVVIGGGIDDWEYGVDLYTGSTTNNYSVADIRLSRQNRIHTGSGAPNFATVEGSIYLRVDGASAAEVLYVNHDGQAGSWAALT